MRPLSYVAFLFFLVGLFLAGFSLWSDGRSGRHRAMAVAGGLLAWWAFCMILVYGSESGPGALFWYQLSLPGILFLIPAVYWIYLDQAGVRPWVKNAVVASVAGFGAVLYAMYWADSFYFGAFRPGPWGNVGIVTEHPTWYLMGSVFYQLISVAMVVLLFRCRAKVSAARLRRLYGANALGLIATALLFGVSWALETYGAWPPMDMLAAGFYLLGVNFYLMGRYRYLMRDPTLNVGQLGNTLPEALVVLDARLVITSVNAAARALLAGAAGSGQALAELFDQSEAIGVRWRQALQDKEPGVNLAVTRRGRSFDLNLAPHFDKFGDVSGAVAVLRPADEGPVPGPETGLTARELEVLDLVLRGHDNKSIAGALFVSVGTVKNHLYRLYKKVNVESRLELMNRFRPGSTV